MQTRLNLDPAVVREARELAARAGQPIVEMARTHTTVSVERAVLRLAGLQGADPDGMPWVNRLVDAVREATGLEQGVALPAWDALRSGGYDDLAALAEAAAQGKVQFRIPAGDAAKQARAAASAALTRGFAKIDANRARLCETGGDGSSVIPGADRGLDIPAGYDLNAASGNADVEQSLRSRLHVHGAHNGPHLHHRHDGRNIRE